MFNNIRFKLSFVVETVQNRAKEKCSPNWKCFANDESVVAQHVILFRAFRPSFAQLNVKYCHLFTTTQNRIYSTVNSCAPKHQHRICSAYVHLAAVLRFQIICSLNQLTCGAPQTKTESATHKFQCRALQRRDIRKNCWLFCGIFHYRSTQLTCLAVSKYAGIVSLKCIFQYIPSNRIEYLLLWGKVHHIRVRWIKTMIKCECFWLFSVMEIMEKSEWNLIKWNFNFIWWILSVS